MACDIPERWRRVFDHGERFGPFVLHVEREHRQWIVAERAAGGRQTHGCPGRDQLQMELRDRPTSLR